MQHVTVRVPASTSNLGPGFDCLGVALRRYNHVTVRRHGASRHSAFIEDIAAKFFAIANCKPFRFSCAVSGDVPVARGLGSSATIRVGLLHALDKVAGTKLSRHQLFTAAAELEQHPDNAAPASFGGFTVARGSHVQRFPVSTRLLFILLVPDFEIETAKARALLPKKIPRRDAVMSAGNAAAITAAFASQAYENLRGRFFDGLHQPYRAKLVPYAEDTIKAAERAGALGAFLSGSGSAICAVALDDADRIATAMRGACPHARAIITRADNRGVNLVKSNVKLRATNIS